MSTEYSGYPRYPEYARLGNNCNSDLSTLVSNAKFIPVNSPLYRVFPTPGYILYPGQNTNHLPLKKNPEHVLTPPKDPTLQPSPVKETYENRLRFSRKSCRTCKMC